PEFAIYPEEGAQVAKCRPLEKNRSLYAEFAKLDGSPQSCLDFAKKYGLLSLSNYDCPADAFEALETLRHWRAFIEHIRSVIALCELGHSHPEEAFRNVGKQEFLLYASFDLSLSMKSQWTPPSINARCQSLLGAIELQAIQSIIAGRKAVQCIECSTWFEVGSGARRSQA